MILVCVLIVIFFFQAEDGIRDAQESRGLGDVYKRQAEKEAVTVTVAVAGLPGPASGGPRYRFSDGATRPVSYTHLTLPTIYSV